MAETLQLFGYHYSVYTRSVRMALTEMDLQARYIETNPFEVPKDPVLTEVTPLHRVPVLKSGTFVLTETAAILRYLDAISGCKSLIPDDPRSLARMAQIIGLIDSYGYVPLVRQVFAQSVFRPFMNEPSDPDVIASGLKAARPVLLSLERIAQEGLVLNGSVTLADLHLSPMIAYFDMAAEGHELLAEYPGLSCWWHVAKSQPALTNTDPFENLPLA